MGTELGKTHVKNGRTSKGFFKTKADKGPAVEVLHTRAGGGAGLLRHCFTV